MKISKRDLGLLLGAFGVLLAVAAYSLVFTPYGDKTESLKAELVTLQEQEARYAELAANKQFYEEEIQRMTDENSKIIAEFPAGIEPESEIMYVVEMEENLDIRIPSISYGTASPLFASASGEAAAEGEEGAEGESTDDAAAAASEDEFMAYLIPMNVSYSTSYQGLKDTITYTNDHQNRMVIDTVSVSYDATTGQVSGSMTFNLYYMTGTGTEYKEPYVPQMQMGVSNIFGTIEYDDTVTDEGTTEEGTTEETTQGTNE